MVAQGGAYMTDEDLDRIDWRVSFAEVRIGGMLLMFGGHVNIGNCGLYASVCG
jgi:hypothetical protein